MSLWEGLVSGSELDRIKKERSQRYIFKVVPSALYSEMAEKGWELNKQLKKSVSLKKQKSEDEQFEDEVWTVLANLGFTEMSRDRNFKIQYGSQSMFDSQQIDVFAVDSEAVLAVECKTTSSCKAYFKGDIEAWRGIKGDVIKAIKDRYPKQKIKFIFATKGCYLSGADRDRLKGIDFIHFDENDIKYYRELSKHLGSSARYQLLGNLFAGQKIQGLNNEVLAIRGSMGGKTYYSFAIEPERLLKIGYVLHRNNPNGDPDLVPTYQRLIKKDRLRSIHQFLDNGGYFPNSIIINIDARGKALVFDSSGMRSDVSEARAGILHLPQTYRAAYIIDGQHRLYGYAESKYVGKDTVPVIAFLDLPEKEQLQLFVDINENQKVVNKNLRLTLEDDLYWNSADKNLQRQALRSRIARRLGEDKYSPLHNHILIGEDTEKTAVCCIAMKFVTDALASSNFFTKYGKSHSVIHGSFDRDNLDATFGTFYPFLVASLEVMRDALSSEWDRGSQNNGILTINIGIFAYIKVLNDIVEYLVHRGEMKPTNDKAEEMVKKITPYLQPLIEYYKYITPKEREEIKKKRGSGGQGHYWHILQQAINSEFPEFIPSGLEDWAFANKHTYNDETLDMLKKISDFVHEDIRNRLIRHYKDSWFVQGLPKAVYDKTNKQANDYKYANSATGQVKEPWEFTTLTDCKNIITQSGNWAQLFESNYTHPRYYKSKEKKARKTEWLNLASKLLAQDFDEYSVSEEEYIEIKDIYNWLIPSV